MRNAFSATQIDELISVYRLEIVHTQMYKNGEMSRRVDLTTTLYTLL